MNVSAILVAAGAGTRFGTKTPKQFLDLGGRPVLLWSLAAFDRSPFVKEIIVVVPSSEEKTATNIIKSHLCRASLKVVLGGATRQDSVKSGLDAVDPDLEWVAVHDAARPLVTDMQIESVCLMAHGIGAAILAFPVQDTVKEVDENGVIIRTQDRSRLYLAQTPQVCRKQDLQSAYGLAGEKVTIKATDEAGLLETLGIAIGVVKGSPSNLKITTQEDLKIAEALIGSHPAIKI